MSKKIIISFIMVFFWMLFIFFMSNRPSYKSDNDSRTIVIYMIEKIDKIFRANSEKVKRHKSEEFVNKVNGIFRKLSHVFVYLVLSILFYYFLLNLNKYSIHKLTFLSFMFCFLYSCSDEFHQTFVTGRSGEVRDILIDTIGIVLGILIHKKIIRVR